MGYHPGRQLQQGGCDSNGETLNLRPSFGVSRFVQLGELYVGLGLLGVVPGFQRPESAFCNVSGVFLIISALFLRASATPRRPTPVYARVGNFEVVLTAAGKSRIGVIKVVREISGLGLKEAKDLVEGPPQTVRQGISKEDAEAMRNLLTEQGATAEVRTSANPVASAL